MLRRPLCSMPCDEGTSRNARRDLFSEWGTSLTKTRVVQLTESQRRIHCGADLSAVSLTSQGCNFMTCLKPEKRSRTLVELLERTPKSCWAPAPPSPHLRKNR